MEITKKETSKGKGNITLSHRPAGVGSIWVNFSFDADFLQFLSETTPSVDFYGFVFSDGETKRVYARKNIPSKQIPKSVVKRILSNPDAKHYALPAYQRYKPNCSLFGIGSLPSDWNLQGVRHLRVEHNGESAIFVATRQKLTYLEAIETAMWFRAAIGLQTAPRGDSEVIGYQEIPVPVTFDDGTHHAKAELVAGEPLNVPDFPTRATFMIEHEIPGWGLESYNLNQRSRIGALSNNSTHPQVVMSLASGIAHYELAAGSSTDDEIAQLIADHFCEYLEKYRSDPNLALKRGYQYLEATKKRIQIEDRPF